MVVVKVQEGLTAAGHQNCHRRGPAYLANMADKPDLPEDLKSGVIEMALSDHVSFADIQTEYGLSEKDVKELMRSSLKSGSYKAWRKRVRRFGDRRETYK